MSSWSSTRRSVASCFSFSAIPASTPGGDLAVVLIEAPDIQALAAEFWQPDAMSVAAVGPNPDRIRAGIANLTPHLADVVPLDLAEEALAR